MGLGKCGTSIFKNSAPLLIEQLKNSGHLKGFFCKSTHNPDGEYGMYWNFSVYVYKE